MSLRARISYIWRLFATALAFSMFGVGGILVPLISTPVLYLMPGSPEQSRMRARRLVHWLFKGFVHILRLLGVLTWKIEGLEKLNRKGLLVLANHPTLLDVVFLVAFLPEANCVVKSTLLRNPVMRGLIGQAGYIPNDDGEKLLVGAGDTIKSGGVLVIFPEGTRTTPGEPLKFQRGAANVAVRCQVDVTPVVIGCTPPALSKAHKWYHIPPRPLEMSFSVKDDLSITPFSAYPATLAARRLTTSLEQFFTKEKHSHG